jgi:CubicO group peptidase (beta-lactamase class C family)
MRSPKEVLKTEPGTAAAYSNTGYVLLAQVLERTSGRTYAELLREKITGPLGLLHTAPDDRADVVPGRVQGYLIDRAAAGRFRNNSFVSGTWGKGAGNIRSTAEELCVWQEALFAGRVLKPASLEAMLAPTKLRDGSEAKPAYGLGMMIGEAQGRRYYHHDGATAGFAAHVMSFPNAGATLAYVFNADWGENRPDPEALRLMNAFRGAALRLALS